MHYLEGMQDPDSHDHLLTNLSRIVFLQVVIILDELVEILALDQFGNYVDVGLCLDHFLKLEEQRMRNGLHYAALMAE